MSAGLSNVSAARSAEFPSLMPRMVRPLFVGLLTTAVGVLLYVSWTLEQENVRAGQRNVALAQEISKLRADSAANDKRGVIQQNQLKEAQRLYTDCQESYKVLTTSADKLRGETDAVKRKIDLLERQIRQRDITIQKLLQPIAPNGDIPAAVADGQAMQLLQAGCVQWTELPDKNSVNGVREFQYTTVSDCQMHCIKVVSCVAVDFDIHSKPTASCWMHTQLTDLDFENTYSQTGTTQYRINRICKPGALQQNKTFPATLIPRSKV